MSIFTRLWNTIRNPIRCVGRDLEGNRFYERPSPNDLTRTTRSIQYQNPEDMWKYIGGGKRLPIQWSAWMTHTRLHPPTIEELQADVARQRRVLANVALIEARDRAEEQQRMKIRQDDAQRALQRALTDVSSSAEYSYQEQRPERQNDSANSTNTTASDVRSDQERGREGEVKEAASPVLSSGPLAQANGPKIRPPAFLTPTKSPKFQTTTMPISVSSDVSRNAGHSTQGAFRQEHQRQRKKAEMEPLDKAQSAGSDSAGIQTQKPTDGANPLPVMPSRVTETESWAPKARARGG